MMNDFNFKKEKTIEVLNTIKKGLISDKRTIEKAIGLDEKEWEYKVDFNKLLEEIETIKSEEYLPVFSKEKIVDGIGKIALISNQNPYLIFNFILSSVYTNNKVEVILENKMLATNKIIIESICKALKDLKIDEDTVSYIILDNKEGIVAKQDNYDLIYYFGKKEEYFSFIKRIHIDTKFDNFGEIDLCFDAKEWKEKLVEIEKWAYLNEIKINYYHDDLESAIKVMNEFNNINKMTIVFSKNIDTITRLVKEVKSEEIYININSTDFYKPKTNLNHLVYTKIIKW